MVWKQQQQGALDEVLYTTEGEAVDFLGPLSSGHFTILTALILAHPLLFQLKRAAKLQVMRLKARIPPPRRTPPAQSRRRFFSRLPPYLSLRSLGIMSSDFPPAYGSVAASSSSSPLSRPSSASSPAPSTLNVGADEIALIQMPMSETPPGYPSLSAYPAQTSVTRLTDLLDDGGGGEEGEGKKGKASLSMTLVEGVVFVVPPTVSYDPDGVEVCIDEGRGVSFFTDRIEGAEHPAS
jgi:hypothetical protein